MSFQPPHRLSGEGRKKEIALAAHDDSPTTPPRRQRGPARTVVRVLIAGRIGRADAAGLCGRIRELLDRSHAGLVVCDVAGVEDPDLGTVDVLARLQLTARREGSLVCLRHATLELRELLALAGLRDVVPCSEELRVEAKRQTEEGEQPGGVEKEGDPADPIVRDLEDL